ncbi:hypothetical protein [Moorena sp. SIO3A2]|uniref:hypothetical protein n=1 Tax=Moorena sp. SIO3A2 TaxID=2607841 RepID=UPI0013BD9391|nr:hypothetical protein [Moorena sp. SIO3A2]NEQ15691.1 hypothetical protein [Moorena sp. SIO3E2]NER85530.1 hypothetical protein [Moorena sp. SIO3A2]
MGRIFRQSRRGARTGRICGIGILLWNWHQASFMLIVGRAGCGIRRGTGIKPVSTYCRAGRMPTLLLFSAKIQQRHFP